MDRAREVATALFGGIGRHTKARVGLGDASESSLAEELAGALEQLGVTFIKLGQTLSTRKDLLPAAYVTALERLRDDVEPMPWEMVAQCIEAAYGQPYTAVFETIDPTPVGAASIGQVHRAKLWDGRQVAIKVQRPEARPTVEQDLSILKTITGRLGGLSPLGDTVDMRELVATFAVAIELELDYRIEAANLRRLRGTMSAHPHLAVPKPVDELTCETILVMDFVDGTPLSQVTHIEDGPAIARDLCTSYFDQILDTGFFHADPHPGNLVLAEDGRLHILDLGFVESLQPQERSQVAQLVLSIVEGAGNQTADVLEGMCTAGEDPDRDGLLHTVQRAVRRATALRGVEPVFGATIYALLGACTEHGYRPPVRLASLARTLTMLDEVFALLDPEFDAATVVQARAGTFARDQIWGELGGSLGARQGLLLSQLAMRAPERIGQLLDRLAAGTFEVQVDAFDEEATLATLQKIANRIAGALIVAALLMAGAMLADSAGPTILGLPIESVVFLALGGLGASTLLLSILWTDR